MPLRPDARLIFALALCAACADPDTTQIPGAGSPNAGSPTGGTSGGSPTGSATGTTDTGDTGDTGTVGTPFDCATVPSMPTSNIRLGAPRGYHDLAFTDDGWMIGMASGNDDLIKVDEYDNVEIVVPDIGMSQQFEWLPDGDLAVASTNLNAILRVGVGTGAVSMISPNVGGSVYGLILGPDGKLWVANQDAVKRIDIATGAQETVIGGVPNGTPRVIAFNHDATVLFIGTNFGNGNLFAVDLDTNYDPVGPPYVFATNVGTGSYHDGLGVDVCGYLYVPDYSTSALYRISPDGLLTQQNFYDTALQQYGHGLEWGNGTSIWRTDAIYLPTPYSFPDNQVIELVIGAPKVWDGPVINLP